MSEATSAFRYSEAKFAEARGLSRGDAKYLRDQNLTKDEHWRRANGEIALTRSGITRICRRLEKKPVLIDLSACEIVNGAGKKVIAPDPRRLVRVTQVTMNPAIVKARDERHQDYTVRRLQGFYFVGLQLEVVPDLQPGLWRIVSAVPRFPGDQAYKHL